MARDPRVKARLWAGLSQAAWQRHSPREAIVASLNSLRSQPSKDSAQALIQQCSQVGVPSNDPEARDAVKTVAAERGATLRRDTDAKLTGPVLAQGTCVAVGPAAVRNTDAGGEIWFKASARVEGVVQGGWLRDEDLLPPNDSAAWLARCDFYFRGGMVAQAAVSCRRSIEAAEDPSKGSAAAHQILGIALLQGNKTNEALDHFIDAYKQAPDATLRQDSLREIERICTERNVPPKPQDDPRRYKVVSWKGDVSNMRNEPSTTSGTSRILGALSRGACVLAGEPSRVQLRDGSIEIWYPVEAILHDKLTQGWMHQVLLTPP